MNNCRVLRASSPLLYCLQVSNIPKLSHSWTFQAFSCLDSVIHQVGVNNQKITFAGAILDYQKNLFVVICRIFLQCQEQIPRLVCKFGDVEGVEFNSFFKVRKILDSQTIYEDIRNRVI